jgi:diguanylate cyclase (GGDEF)-like protein
MQQLSMETSHAFTRKIMLPLAALVLGLLVFATGGIIWVAEYQTSVAIGQQARLAGGALRIQAERLATSAADYGFWDDAVAAIVEAPDRTWMDENIGAGAAKSLGVEMSFALDPQDRVVYSYLDGASASRSAVDRLGKGFEESLRAWRAMKPGSTYSGLLPYADTAVVIAIAPVRPFTRSELPPTGYAIVFIRTIDAELREAVARDYELTDFHVVRAGSDIGDARAVVEVKDPADPARAARFAWTPQRPGDELLGIALPFMALFVALFSVFTAVVLNYTISSAHLISDRENKAAIDPLTGLANRARFFAVLDTHVERATPDRTLAVMYIDLDGFKTVNDTMGHAAGDELLRQMAVRFKASVAPDGIVARLGGDEFAVILPDADDQGMVQAVAARLLIAASDPFDLSAGPAQVSCSIGIAMACGDDNAGADVLNRADNALYQAKASGKNAMRMSAPALAGTPVAENAPAKVA